MSRISYVICLALILAACGAPTADTDEVATRVAATLQAAASAAAALPSATMQPSPTVALPTFTPTSQPSSTPEQGRLSFSTGATQGVVSDRVEANQVVAYMARAAQGQVMILTLSNGNAVLEVIGADGATLLARSTRYTSFRSVLPKTQDYSIRVVGGNTAQDFTLSVVFAVPVAFGSGQDSVTYEGQTVGGYPVTYALFIRENDDLHVRLNTNSSDAALTIWGFDDGTPYARAQNGVTDFSLDVPETQYYIIEVVPQGGRVIAFEVEIEVD
ncbi:MAG: hypothetical protein WD751_07545 [Anaerolineales bacterium]